MPAWTATPNGEAPTGTVATTALMAVSITDTLLLFALETYAKGAASTGADKASAAAAREILNARWIGTMELPSVKLGVFAFAGFTVCGSVLEVTPLYVLSPEYTVVIECVPWVRLPGVQVARPFDIVSPPQPLIA